MFEKLHALEKRFDELNHLLSQPDVIADQPKFQKLAKEHASLKKIVDTFQLYKKNIEALSENEVLLKDETQEKELRNLADDERKEIQAKLEKIEFDLKTLLVPKDPRDEKNAILEIRAGTGGEEAALFSANLFRMYSKYA